MPRLSARLFTLWLLLSPSGLVLANLQPQPVLLSDANGMTTMDANGVRQLTPEGIAYRDMSALSKMGESYYWQQAGLNATLQGAASRLQGGQFRQGFIGGLSKSIGGSFNTAVGDWAKSEGMVADGGLSKMLLHGGIGALQSAATRQSIVGGVVGGMSAELLSPLNSQLDAQTGNTMSSQLLTATTAMLITSAIKPGDTNAMMTAAGQALQTDQLNRQLHPSELLRIKQLAQGDPQKEARLTAAACAEVRCAEGVPKDDPNYAYLKGLQDYGMQLSDERLLLSNQSGWSGRTAGPLFKYGVVDQGLDWASQNKVGARAGGALLMAGGGGLVLSGAGTCSTGLGCALGAGGIVLGWDYLQAGSTSLVTGNWATPYGERVLQSLGLSPEAAALTYGTLGLLPATLPAVVQGLQKSANFGVAVGSGVKGGGGWSVTGGAGPISGTIGITDQTSVTALRNYYPKGGGVEFVYDPATNAFVAGRPAAGLLEGSPHQQLAQSIGAADRPVVGGTLQRGANGEFITTENSGHFGQNWTDSIRQQFQTWLSNRTGIPVNHQTWGR